jgi:hypothetical protein
MKYAVIKESKKFTFFCKTVYHGRKTEGKTINDDRLFPFSDAVVRELWSGALTKTGLAEIDSSTVG